MQIASATSSPNIIKIGQRLTFVKTRRWTFL